MIYLFSGALVAALVVIAGLVVWVGRLRKQSDRDAASLEAAWKVASRHRGTLEAIRDSGPKGPDPLPPCPWCAQGSGHWGMVRNERGHWVEAPQNNPRCPSVVAWGALKAELENQ